MTRGLLFIPVLVMATALAGVGLCRAAGVDPVMFAVEMAAVVGLISAELGLLPVMIYRGADPAVRFQMAWIGSILHLVLSAGLGGAAFFLLRPPATPFVLWLLVMYWVTLSAMVAVLVRAIRTPLSKAGNTAAGTGILPGNPG